MLIERKKYLQKQVNDFVRSNDTRQAFGALSKLDDMDKLLSVVSLRIEKLKKEEQ